MVVEDTIECPRCGRSIVPRLNAYGSTALTFARVQAICPLCGEVVFESQGGVRWQTVIFLLVTVGGCALVVVLGVLVSGR